MSNSALTESRSFQTAHLEPVGSRLIIGRPELDHLESSLLFKLCLVDLSARRHQLRVSLRQKCLDQLVDVVGRLLEWIGLVDPVEDDVACTLMTKLKWHLSLTRLHVHLGGRAAQEEESLMALADEAVVLPSNGWSRISVLIHLNIFLLRGVEHDVYHVFDIFETLSAEVI